MLYCPFSSDSIISWLCQRYILVDVGLISSTNKVDCIDLCRVEWTDSLGDEEALHSDGSVELQNYYILVPFFGKTWQIHKVADDA
jgi:hypothetical protein